MSGAKREMTLLEWVGTLPEQHRARKELDALLNLVEVPDRSRSITRRLSHQDPTAISTENIVLRHRVGEAEGWKDRAVAKLAQFERQPGETHLQLLSRVAELAFVQAWSFEEHENAIKLRADLAKRDERIADLEAQQTKLISSGRLAYEEGEHAFRVANSLLKSLQECPVQGFGDMDDEKLSLIANSLRVDRDHAQKEQRRREAIAFAITPLSPTSEEAADLAPTRLTSEEVVSLQENEEADDA